VAWAFHSSGVEFMNEPWTMSAKMAHHHPPRVLSRSAVTTSLWTGSVLPLDVFSAVSPLLYQHLFSWLTPSLGTLLPLVRGE
jgi:hypothetical protein